MDRRYRLPEKVWSTLKAHGVAGLMLEPERTLLSCSEPKARTAFHHTHLTAETFTTIACSLAEGVGVRTTSRIMGVDKKTVLRVLERAARHVASVSRSLLKGLLI